MAVALNVDLGELQGEPVELYSIATWVNVACGGHAGDEVSMEAACRAARAAGARLAAHPSYPDREGFGRRSLDLEPEELERSLLEQLLGLRRVAEITQLRIEAVKPHGALYHDVARDPGLAALLARATEAALSREVAFVGPPGGALARLAACEGWPYLREGFADRAYDERGELVPRGALGALLTDPALACQQALALACSGRFDSLCVHGDTPGALGIARAVREALEAAGELA